MATWVGYPKSYSPGRNRPVQYVVIHATQGSEGPTSAENGATYDKRRTDGVSTHIFVDSDSAVREVPDADRAHHARVHGNEIGLGVELCGLSQQTSAQWHDANSWPMIQIAAREVAQMCRDHNLPPVRLTVAQVRAAYYAPVNLRPKGICAHDDVSKAYPEDQGSHWDPGPNFPWDEFLAMVRAELEDDVTPEQAAQLKALYQAHFQGGKSCGDIAEPANGRPASNSTVQKLDALLQRPANPPVVVDVAVVKAALLDTEVLSALAQAVNDDHAKRMQA